MRPVFLFLPALLYALPPQRPEQSAPPPTQVSLNVVALDGRGQSVTDLAAADFRITDNGKPQQIASFRSRASRSVPPAPLGPRQYSNRSGAAVPHATVILFDLMNTQFQDRGYVLNQLIRRLQDFENADNLYLYLITTSGALYAVHGLPTEQTDAASATRPWTRDIQSTLNEAMRVTLAHRPPEIYYDIDLRVRTTFSVLSVVAARLAGVPGRKNIVWLTHGVPISLGPVRSGTGDVIDYTPYIRELSNTLDRAGVSIYAVQQSPPGTATSGVADTERAPLGRGIGGEPNTPTTGLGSEETLTEFTNLTGGRAYENNDIGGAIKQAVNDARQSYSISYSPPPENWDGKYHKIRVTCARKGVHVQARQGYYAFAEQTASAKQEQDAIEAVVQSPFDAAEIGMRATTTPLPGATSGLKIAVRVDTADVRFSQSADIYMGQLAVRFVLYQEDGAIRQTKPAEIAVRLTRQQYDAALKEGLPIDESLATPPHARKIRAIVFDSDSTAIGSLTIPLEK